MPNPLQALPEPRGPALGGRHMSTQDTLPTSELRHLHLQRSGSKTRHVHTPEHPKPLEPPRQLATQQPQDHQGTEKAAGADIGRPGLGQGQTSRETAEWSTSWRGACPHVLQVCPKHSRMSSPTARSCLQCDCSSHGSRTSRSPGQLARGCERHVGPAPPCPGLSLGQRSPANPSRSRPRGLSHY